ncbi:hypothetical protein O185_07495 [Photorhabdus temperata J3]|uniref:Uncharacterized protein n=1 Tax=Photorhabdus temperata J3 TaxID=1389415 RepID=U7R280_PHOTE|nr:hypothetical protein O185_07495 [Photorhabdus temperata J3]
MGIDLPLIWFIIIVFSTMMYIVMDGFDLGIGLLYPTIKSDSDRDLMMNSVAPVWMVTKPGWYLEVQVYSVLFLWLMPLYLMH